MELDTILEIAGVVALGVIPVVVLYVKKLVAKTETDLDDKVLAKVTEELAKKDAE